MQVPKVLPAMSTMAGTISTNCLYLCRTISIKSADVESTGIVSGKRRREFCIDGWLLTRGIPSRFSSGLVVRMKLFACPKNAHDFFGTFKDPKNPWKNGGFFRPPNMGYISSLKMKVMGSHNLISIVLKCCFVFYWCLLEFFRSTVLLNNRHRTKRNSKSRILACSDPCRISCFFRSLTTSSSGILRKMWLCIYIYININTHIEKLLRAWIMEECMFLQMWNLEFEGVVSQLGTVVMEEHRHLQTPSSSQGKNCQQKFL